MAGGVFSSQNKVRAGAYINFVSVPRPMTKVGTRGIATIAVPLSWGDTLTELYSTDLTDGSALAKIGLDISDDAALIFRKLLSHTYKAFIYRLDTNGKKATATVGTKVYTAKYAGAFGNNIQIVVNQNLYKWTGATSQSFYTEKELEVGTVAYKDKDLNEILGVVTSYSNTSGIKVKINDGTEETVTAETSEDVTYTVQTLVSGVRKDSQVVKDGSELVNNAYVTFDEVPTLQVTAGTALAGGEDGTVSDATYTQYFAEMGKHKFDTMGLPYATSTAVKDAAVLFITQQCEQYGRKRKVVLYNTVKDSDYVINSVNGYVTTEETVSPEIFVAEVTGMDAGANINESLTYAVVADPEIAVEIIDQVDDKDIEKALNAGKFILSKRDDGAIVVEKDINTLHTFTPHKNYAFSKNRVKRTLDEIANTCKLTWETTYVGKVDNNESGRNIFKSDIINYLNTLQNTYNAIQNFDGSKDIEVLPGEDIDAVVCNLTIQPVDSMEKLYMTVKVNG